MFALSDEVQGPKLLFTLSSNLPAPLLGSPLLHGCRVVCPFASPSLFISALVLDCLALFPTFPIQLGRGPGTFEPTAAGTHGEPQLLRQLVAAVCAHSPAQCSDLQKAIDVFQWLSA